MKQLYLNNINYFPFTLAGFISLKKNYNWPVLSVSKLTALSLLFIDSELIVPIRYKILKIFFIIFFV